MFSSKNLCVLKSECSSPPLSKQTDSPVNFRPATQRDSDHLPPVPRIVLEHVGTRAECPRKTSAIDDETTAPWRFQRGWGLHREGKWLPIPHNLLQIFMQKNLCCFPDLNALYLGVSIQSWARRVVLGFKGLKRSPRITICFLPLWMISLRANNFEAEIPPGFFFWNGGESKFYQPGCEIEMAPDCWSSYDPKCGCELASELDPTQEYIVIIRVIIIIAAIFCIAIMYF